MNEPDLMAAADAPAIDASFDALHAFLTHELKLLAEPAHGGTWRTYFFGEIVWHPATTTRTVKVLLDHRQKPFRVQLCVSSDNNNSVFMTVPFSKASLAAAVEGETLKLISRKTGRDG